MEKGRSHRQLLGDKSVVGPLAGLGADGCSEYLESSCHLVPEDHLETGWAFRIHGQLW